jgi:putative oxidoreductase
VFLPLLNGGTAAILFCFACLYLSAAGGGPISVDALLRKEDAEPSGAYARR